MSDRLDRVLSTGHFRRLVLFGCGVLGVGSSLAILTSSVLRGDQTTGVSLVRPNASTSADSVIHALARLEPASGLIVVGARPGVRIEEVRVAEGDEIKAGAVLAILEGHTQAQRQLDLAEAQKKSADFQRSIRRDKLALAREAEDQLKASRHDTTQQVAQTTRQKFQELKALEKTVSPLIEKDARAKYEIAQAAFQLEVSALKAELELKALDAEEASRPKLRQLEDKELADVGPETDVLLRQIDQARDALAQTEVRAPGPGIVLELHARAGEVSSGPLLSLGDLSAMVAKAEVYQTDVARVSLGDKADVLVQGKEVTGKVVKIGRTVGGNELRSLDPRALQDLRVVSVTIALDSAAEASQYVRRQVDVSITPAQVERK